MVFIVVQNLVGIDAVVSIICKFFLQFTSLARKCLFTPDFGIFGDLSSLLDRNINEAPKRHILAWKYVYDAYRSSKSVRRCDMCAWWKKTWIWIYEWSSWIFFERVPFVYKTLIVVQRLESFQFYFRPSYEYKYNAW